MRRFFTIASSPTEKEIHVAVKVPQQSSSFKQGLLTLQKGDSIIASQLSGDFILPQDSTQKLVFIAGGIGITPFRSMLQYLIDMQEKRDIILFYANNAPIDFVYQDVFTEAEKKIGLKTHYVISNKDEIPTTWPGLSGHITGAMLKEHVVDYKTRIFYLSGPNTMVDSYKTVLQSIGVVRRNIITDYFPGY